MSEPTARHPHGQVTTEIVDEHVWVMTIDRAEKKNGLTPKIFIELADAYTRLDEDPDLFVGVLSFAGADATAGLDMPLMFAPDTPRPEGHLVDPFGLRRRVTKPIVTAVQGTTYTAGIELALAGDIVVASSDTKFSQLEPKRGLTALGGATFRFVERGGWGNAMYHLLLADVFDADEALRIGIVQEIVEPGTQIQRAIALAQIIAKNAPLGLHHTLANARRLSEAGEARAVQDIASINRALVASEDFSEGVASFVERRDAKFTGR
jgi:enoyl-CoA hydratase/carnithine racemase